MEVSLLLVEDNPGDAAYIERKLLESSTNFAVTKVGWLNTAVQIGVSRQPDVCLLDLSLPDSQGIDTVVEFIKQCPDVPVVVMTGYNDLETAMNTVRLGAQDYLIKGEIQALHLERTVMLAIERKRVDSVRRRLLKTSVKSFAENTVQGSADAALLRGHVDNLSKAYAAVLEYLRKNAPAHLENVQKLFDAHDVSVTMQEVQDLLNLRKRTQTVSMRALSDQEIEKIMVRNGEDSTPPSSDEAASTILDIIERREGVAS